MTVNTATGEIVDHLSVSEAMDPYTSRADGHGSEADAPPSVVQSGGSSPLPAPRPTATVTTDNPATLAATLVIVSASLVLAVALLLIGGVESQVCAVPDDRATCVVQP